MWLLVLLLREALLENYQETGQGTQQAQTRKRRANDKLTLAVAVEIVILIPLQFETDS